MSLTRKEKEGIVKEIEELLAKSRGVIFTDATGVSTTAIRPLRSALKSAGSKYSVVKRTLMRIAMRSLGINAGPHIARTSIAMVSVSEDIPAVAKALYEFSKKEKNFKILNAYDIGEKQWIEAANVVLLARLPSRQDLLAQLAYVLKSPMKKFAFVLNQVVSKNQ